MSKELTYLARIRTDGTVGDHLQEQIREELAANYGGCFVRITITGTEPEEQDYRGAYFAGVIPEVLRAWREAGNNFDPHNHRHRTQAHQFLKENFTEHGTTKGFTPQDGECT